MKNKIVAFSPADNNFLVHFEKLEKSFHKFHPDIELRRFDNPNPNDKDFWYRATPIIAKDLMKEFDTVIKLDSDQIILDKLDIFEGDYDVGVVLNDPTYPITVWDIGAATNTPYFNNGLVVLKNKDFVDHWYKLCFSRHFNVYQFREQDLLNLLCSDYFNYKVRCFDGSKFYGEFAKPAWTRFKMEDNKVMLDGRQLMVYHSGGGNVPDKGNYRIRFQEDVVKYIDSLVK